MERKLLTVIIASKNMKFVHVSKIDPVFFNLVQFKNSYILSNEIDSRQSLLFISNLTHNVNIGLCIDGKCLRSFDIVNRVRQFASLVDNQLKMTFDCVQ